MSSLLDVVAQLETGGRYGACVAGTLLVYDYILTIQQEISLIWHAPWSYGKLLFLLIRYTGFSVIPGFFFIHFSWSTSEISCSVVLYLLMGSLLVIIHCSNLILALRTWAIWHRNFLCGIFVGVTWFAITVVTTVFLIYSCIGVTPDGDSLFSGIQLQGCSALDSVATAAAATKVYSFLAAYEGVIFLLTVSRGLNYIYDARPTALMFTLYRDAFLASACLLALSVANAVLNSMNSTWFYLPYQLDMIFYFIVPCRIIINLRASTNMDDWDLATTKVPTTVDHIHLQHIGGDSELFED